MMKKLGFAILTFLSLLVSQNARANQEFNITLSDELNQPTFVEVPFGRFTVALSAIGNTTIVRVYFENTTMSEAVLLFKKDLDEKTLKKTKPEVKFEKTYQGDKGRRKVMGCSYVIGSASNIQVMPGESSVPVADFVILSNGYGKFELPMYLASFKGSQYASKGKSKITYKILSEDIVTFNITIKPWTTDDPEYKALEAAVEEFESSLRNVTFCTNSSKHATVEQQQAPYAEKLDSLLGEVEKTLRLHPEWESSSKPYEAYSALRKKLKEINLNSHKGDCGQHSKPIKPREKSCANCSLSASQVYHQLDDLYKNLKAGKVTKDAAKQKANSLYNCYQQHKKRKKDDSYSGKIADYYGRIVNY